MSAGDDLRNRDATQLETFVLQQALALYIEHQRKYGQDPEEKLFLAIAHRLLDSSLDGEVRIRPSTEHRETTPLDIDSLIGEAKRSTSCR